MANYQENDIDSTTNNFQNLPYDKPTESSNNDQTVSSLVNAGITPSKSNQQQAENIIVKTKKVVQKQCMFDVLLPYIIYIDFLYTKNKKERLV